MRHKWVLLLVLAAILLLLAGCCVVDDGSGHVEATLTGETGDYTIIIKDGSCYNGITLFPDNDEIYCNGQVYKLRLDFVATGHDLNTADFQYTAEDICFMGQLGIDIITGY